MIHRDVVYEWRRLLVRKRLIRLGVGGQQQGFDGKIRVLRLSQVNEQAFERSFIFTHESPTVCVMLAGRRKVEVGITQAENTQEILLHRSVETTFAWYYHLHHTQH